MALWIDIETYSATDLKCGVHRYAQDPEFRVLLIGYALDDADVRVVDVAHGEEIPPVLMDALRDPTCPKYAYNAAFERVCLARAYGASRENWRCVMARAWSLGLSGDLATVAQTVGAAEKLPEGKALIRKFCRPGARQTTALEDEDWETFRRYCARDVEVEREIARKLSRYPEWAHDAALYALDQRINDRGVRIDAELCHAALAIDAAQREELTAAFRALTGQANPNSVAGLKRMVSAALGREVSGLSKTDLPALCAELADAPHLARALEIRAALGKTSVAKYRTMLDRTDADGRARGCLQYLGAQRTGRWAGRGIQLQNLPQNHLPHLDTARAIVREGDLDYMRLYYDDISGTLSQCIRTAIIPADGCRFAVCDYSAIEARVIAWLAGESWVLDAFRAGEDIYCRTASEMFGVPVEKHGVNADLRQKGKVATLACGYQGAVGALTAMGALRMGIPEDDLPELVAKWRAANPRIVALWRKMEDAARAAILERVRVPVVPGVAMDCSGGFLWIELPSGRRIGYPRPGVDGDGRITYQEYRSGWQTIDTYGGKLTENLVQATARDILAEAMLAVEAAGYTIVMHIHDEIVCEVPSAGAENALANIARIMSQGLAWTEGLPLAADGYTCAYYRKD